MPVAMVNCIRCQLPYAELDVIAIDLPTFDTTHQSLPARYIELINLPGDLRLIQEGSSYFGWLTCNGSS